MVSICGFGVTTWKAAGKKLWVVAFRRSTYRRRLGEEETRMDWAMKCEEVYKLRHEEEGLEVLL